MERIEDKIFEQQKGEFLDIFYKIDKENPDKADIQKAEAMIRSNPHIWEIGMGWAGSVLKMFLDKLNPDKGQQLLFEAEALSIKERLGYNSSCQIEKLIIEQIMFCWVGVIYMESKVSAIMMKGEYSRQWGEYWQNTLTRYQNRYLRAVETLARVRRLSKGIAFQFNIAANGGQQVNVNEAIKK